MHCTMDLQLIASLDLVQFLIVLDHFCEKLFTSNCLNSCERMSSTVYCYSKKTFYSGSADGQ